VIILFFTAISTAAGLGDRGDGVEGTGDRVDAAADAGLEDNGVGVEVTGDGVDAAATTSAGGSAARASLETETGSFNP